MMASRRKVSRHTPLRHRHHVETGQTKICQCSLEPSTDYWICTCGAAYTPDMLDYSIFLCHDCSRRTVNPTGRKP